MNERMTLPLPRVCRGELSGCHWLNDAPQPCCYHATHSGTAYACAARARTATTTHTCSTGAAWRSNVQGNGRMCRMLQARHTLREGDPCVQGRCHLSESPTASQLAASDAITTSIRPAGHVACPARSKQKASQSPTGHKSKMTGMQHEQQGTCHTNTARGTSRNKSLTQATRTPGRRCKGHHKPIKTHHESNGQQLNS